VALKKLKEIFNKKSVRAGVLGVALVGAGVGGYLYMNDDDDRTRSASYGPPAVVAPFALDRSKQEAALNEWRPNWQSICHIPGAPGDTVPIVRNPRMEDILRKMSEETLVGRQAVMALQGMGTAVCENNSKNALQAAFIDATNSLTISSHIDPTWQFFYAMRESRHAVQQAQGMWGSVSTTFEESLRIAYAMEADAAATTILAASRLRDRGDASMWNTIGYNAIYSDLKNVFARTMVYENDEMKAAKAVFEAWYENPRRMQLVYNEVLTRRENEKRWPVERPYFEKLPSNFFDKLGELGDGSNYGANKSPNIHKHFKPGA